MKNSMITSTTKSSSICALLCVALFFTACSPAIMTPLYQDPEFTKLRIAEPIYLMPVVDLRVDKTKSIKLDDNALRLLSPTFVKRGYAPLRPILDRKIVQSIVEDDFTYPDSTFLANLGPDKTRWLFCPVLHDFQSKMTFGSTANAEISGYIVDKSRGKIVWRHKGVGQSGQGGLMGMAMKGIVIEEAVNIAFGSLARALPQNAAISATAMKK